MGWGMGLLCFDICVSERGGVVGDGGVFGFCVGSVLCL